MDGRTAWITLFVSTSNLLIRLFVVDIHVRDRMEASRIRYKLAVKAIK